MDQRQEDEVKILAGVVDRLPPSREMTLHIEPAFWSEVDSKALLDALKEYLFENKIHFKDLKIVGDNEWFRVET